MQEDEYKKHVLSAKEALQQHKCWQCFESLNNHARCRKCTCLTHGHEIDDFYCEACFPVKSEYKKLILAKTKFNPAN